MLHVHHVLKTGYFSIFCILSLHQCSSVSLHPLGLRYFVHLEITRLNESHWVTWCPPTPKPQSKFCSGTQQKKLCSFSELFLPQDHLHLCCQSSMLSTDNVDAVEELASHYPQAYLQTRVLFDTCGLFPLRQRTFQLVGSAVLTSFDLVKQLFASLQIFTYTFHWKIRICFN